MQQREWPRSTEEGADPGGNGAAGPPPKAVDGTGKAPEASLDTPPPLAASMNGCNGGCIAQPGTGRGPHRSSGLTTPRGPRSTMCVWVIVVRTSLWPSKVWMVRMSVPAALTTAFCTADAWR